MASLTADQAASTSHDSNVQAPPKPPESAAPAAAQESVASNHPLGLRQVGTGAQTPVPEIKAPPRDEVSRPPERRRGRKLRLLAGALAVLGLGWLAGQNAQSVDMAQTRAWIEQSVGAATSALASLQKGVIERFGHLTGRNVPVVATAHPEQPNNADALVERVTTVLNGQLNQMRASSEGLTRDLGIEVGRLRTTVERSQAELASKLARVTEQLERIERLDRQAAVSQQPQQLAAASPTAPTPPTPPTTQRSVQAATANVTSPPAVAEVRREPTLIKQWRVREVLNGTAILEGPNGVIGVSQGQMVPGVGRVESILQKGKRWVVATSKGVITSP